MGKNYNLKEVVEIEDNIGKTAKVHQIIKRTIPHGEKKARKLFKFKYPKLLLLLLSIILAYYLFKNPAISEPISKLKALSYFGIFISGIFISFGFSAPFAVGFLIVSQPPNILVASLFGALGALIGDVLIFSVIRFSFMKEFQKLKKANTLKKIKKIIKNNLHIKIKHYFVYVFAGILIASPLPDEIGVIMLAGLTTINPRKLAIISFLLHFLFIFILLFVSI